jgi:putative molybdopterin biosynthesis protein
MAAEDSVQRVSLAKAQALLLASLPEMGTEHVAVEAALGRVLADSVFARLASPHYRASAMDGIAVRAADTLPTADGTAVTFVVFDGPDAPRPGPACRVVDTGNPIPEWADAVVRIEDVRSTANGYEVRAPVAPGRDIRAVGEDVAAGALLIGAGRTVRAVDIGGLLGTGISCVAVRKQPRITVLATGAEVIEPLGENETPRPGQVIEFNSRMLAAYASEWGASVEYAGRAQDDAAELAARMRRELERCNVLCVIAGSSAGRKDVTVTALKQLGDLLFRGIDVAPGRPAAAARVGDKIVLAVPGYPVSAVVAYRELLKPIIDAMLRRVATPSRSVRAVVRRDLSSRLGVEEILRVCLAFAGDALVVAPLARGAGSIGTLVQAHGLLRIAPTCEGIAAGSVVDVEILDHGFDPHQALVVGGSGDRWTAALEQALAAEHGPVHVSYLGRSDHDAAAAVGNGEAHVALVPGSTAAGAIQGGSVYVLRSEAGDERTVIALSSALCESALGERVRSAISSDVFSALVAGAAGTPVTVSLLR